MSANDDRARYEEDEARERFIQEQLRQTSEEPVIFYLARFGDAIEERVQRCRAEARELTLAGFHGAALVRSAAGIEITIRFYLARPLLQGAFLSDEWAALLSTKILNGRTAEDRELLPAILRNWNVDISRITLADESNLWERILKRVWPRRNEYVHAGEVVTPNDALLASECLDALLSQIVMPIAVRLGFTRVETGCWSIVLSRGDRSINPPTRHETESPFKNSTAA